MKRTSKLLRALTPIASAAALLAGCAVPGPALVGSDRAAVRAKLGPPDEACPLPGGERWLYPLGSVQQFVWAVEFDAAGRVVRVRQVRTAEDFATVRVGVDRPADILCKFGRPRMTQRYVLSGLVGWLYPYVEDGYLNSEMVIYFDREEVVRRVENGPDPRFLGNGDRK